MSRIVCLDPGLTAAGIAVFDWATRRIVEVRTVKTEDTREQSVPRKPGARRHRKGSTIVEDGRRILQVARAVWSTCESHEADLACIERRGAGQGHRATATMAYGYATAVTIVGVRNMALKTVSVTEVKRALTGEGKADKRAMIAAARERHPELDDLGKVTEHVADAVGIFYAALPWLSDRLQERAA